MAAARSHERLRFARGHPCTVDLLRGSTPPVGDACERWRDDVENPRLDTMATRPVGRHSRNAALWWVWRRRQGFPFSPRHQVRFCASPPSLTSHLFFRFGSNCQCTTSGTSLRGRRIPG